MNRFTRSMLVLGLAFFTISPMFAQTVFTYRAPESDMDTRYDYDRELLQLALDKTVDDFGQYKLVASPRMNFVRAMEVLKTDQLQNAMFKFSATDDLAKDYDYVAFPVDLGIVGYRVNFVSPQTEAKLASVNTIDGLLKYSVGQGYGWGDVEILEKAGFKVQTVSSYESLFKMVAANRFDLFPRGANEIMQEYPDRKSNKNLIIDDKICIFYPLPRFFFTTKGNTEAAKRVQAGLKKAYEDGSYQELWNKYFKANIEYVHLNNRKIFKLDNPFINTIDPAVYEPYFYKPAQ